MFRIVASLLLLAVFWPACDVGSRDADGPRIGLILPFAGELRDGAEQIAAGLEMAFSREGQPFTVILRNDRGQPGRAAELVHELADEGVIAIAGTMSSPCALAAADRAESLGVPFLTPMATHVAVTRGREWVFRVCFTDPSQGARMAGYARDDLGVESVAVVRDVTNDYSLGLTDAFASAFLEQGGRVASVWDWRREYDRGDDLIGWIEQSGADALYLPLYGDDIRAIVDGTEPLWSRADLVFLGGDGWHTRSVTEYLADRPALPRGIHVTAHFARDESRPEVREFLDLYRRETGSSDPTSSAALGYDLGVLLARALKSGASDRAELRDRLREALKHFRGVTGDTFVDPSTGAIEKRVQVLTWSDGGWKAEPSE